MSWDAEGVPRDVEPAVAGQELVGVGVGAKEGHKALELRGVLGTDVGGLAKEVLRAPDTTDEGVDARVAEARIDDDGTNDAAGWFQQVQTAVFHVGNLSDGGDVIRVFTEVQELIQRKMRRELDVIRVFFHDIVS